MADDNTTGKFNQVVTSWKNNVVKNAKSNVLSMTGKGTLASSTKAKDPKLAPNIGASTKKDYGEIFMVGFKFPRHGVWVHKGVSGSPKKGRGWIMISGKVVRTATGIQKGIRVPKDWLNSEIDKSMEELADNLAEIKADTVVNATHAKIK